MHLCTLAGDEGAITVGDNSNLQDNVSVRTSKAYLGGHKATTRIGNNVTVGHGVLLDSVTIEDEALIGMGATLLEGVKVSLCESPPWSPAYVSILHNLVCRCWHGPVPPAAISVWVSTRLVCVQVETGAQVAAGAVVAPDTVIPSGELWGGNPAKLLRPLKQEEADFIMTSAQTYAELASEHLKEIASVQ
jgi:carbonic anhydrase/acetyltransferase-like protein (isoleucine patch superfamily)